jgi:hypothetical protein
VSDPNEITGFAARQRHRTDTEGGTMSTSIPGQQVDTVDLAIPRVVFGIWVIVRTRTADEVEGWIDSERVSRSPTDLYEIAAAIKRTEAGHGAHTPTALAA